MSKLTNTAAGANIAIGVATAPTGALAPGKYLVTSSTDCYIKQGTTGVTVAATDAGAVFLGKGAGVVLDVDGVGNGDVIAAIRLSADGRLCVAKMEGDR